MQLGFREIFYHTRITVDVAKFNSFNLFIDIVFNKYGKNIYISFSNELKLQVRISIQSQQRPILL